MTEMGRTCGTYGGEERCIQGISGDHLEDPGICGRIILKWTCERLDGGAWTGSIWLRIGTGGELL
jgi:hypothetical protein